MNRLQHLFGKKQNNILSIYFTAGYPAAGTTANIIRALDSKGIDMIEVGAPFSDPMADGPVIQQSSTVALRGGMNMKRLLTEVSEARRDCPDIPLVLMGYLNPMMQFGIERLFERCKEAGIDAMIIPDLPFDDYLRDFKPMCERFDIPIVMLITPETSDERIRLIDEHCDGFIYMVSAASTTGTRDSFGEEQLQYFNHLDSLSLKHQRLIGFGISNERTFKDACAHSSGAIIGSKFIKCLSKHPTDIPAAVDELLEAIGRNQNSNEDPE